MRQDGPSDRRFHITGGILLCHPQRDAHFPYLYRVSTHALVHSPNFFKTILVRVVDTSVDARSRCGQFNDTLSVPLGPNSLMSQYGALLRIPIVAYF